MVAVRGVTGHAVYYISESCITKGVRIHENCAAKTKNPQK